MNWVGKVDFPRFLNYVAEQGHRMSVNNNPAKSEKRIVGKAFRTWIPGL